MDSEGLARALQTHIDAIIRTAQASPAGGGREWDALLHHYGIAPFSANERATVVRSMHLARGATPGEVRGVLVALAAWLNGELRRLAENAQSSPNNPLRSQLVTRLATLVDDESTAYERSIGIVPNVAPAAPIAPSLGSIFQNAQQTSKEVPWANMKYNQVNTLTCIHCGGPQETPLDFICKYCRRPIASSNEPNT